MLFRRHKDGSDVNINGKRLNIRKLLLLLNLVSTNMYECFLAGQRTIILTEIRNKLQFYTTDLMSEAPCTMTCGGKLTFINESLFKNIFQVLKYIIKRHTILPQCCLPGSGVFNLKLEEKTRKTLVPGSTEVLSRFRKPSFTELI